LTFNVFNDRIILYTKERNPIMTTPINVPTVVRARCEDGAEWDVFYTGDMPVKEAVTIVDAVLDKAYSDDDFPPDFLAWLDAELKPHGLIRIELAETTNTW
jgi:hypothetical protein